MNRIFAVLFVTLVFAGALSAADKPLMHCFTFTAVESATPADWDAFYKATDALPGKVPAMARVWYGKLVRPQAILGTDAETYKKLMAAKPDGEKVIGPIERHPRQYGVCMEFKSQDGLKSYADSAAHKEWEAVYFKVRVPGTTSFDLVQQ
jgi:hypothetical protein